MRSRLRELMWEREIQQGRRINQIEIARATGLSANTISRWMSPKSLELVRRETVIPLCQYLNVNIGDLIVIEYPNAEETE